MTTPRRQFLSSIAGASLLAAAPPTKIKARYERIEAQAQVLIAGLPSDAESETRAIAFFEQLHEQVGSLRGLRVAKAVYAMAAAGEWSFQQQDIPMLLHGVHLYPVLLPYVDQSITTILRLFDSVSGIQRSWQHVRSCCRGRGLTR